MISELIRITKVKANVKFGVNCLCGHECERSSVQLISIRKRKRKHIFGELMSLQFPCQRYSSFSVSLSRPMPKQENIGTTFVIHFQARTFSLLPSSSRIPLLSQSVPSFHSQFPLPIPPLPTRISILFPFLCPHPPCPRPLPISFWFFSFPFHRASSAYHHKLKVHCPTSWRSNPHREVDGLICRGATALNLGPKSSQRSSGILRGFQRFWRSEFWFQMA